jgi:hypothetical protein
MGPQLTPILGARLDIILLFVDKTDLEVGNGNKSTSTPNFVHRVLDPQPMCLGCDFWEIMPTPHAMGKSASCQAEILFKDVPLRDLELIVTPPTQLKITLHLCMS